MSFIRASAAFLYALFFIPIGMGYFCFPGKNRYFVSIGGLFASLTAFEILALIFHITLGSLRVMTLLWCLLCGSIAAAGIWKKTRMPKCQNMRKESWDTYEKILFVITLGLIFAQTLNTVLRVYYANWDDETYCATAVVSYFTDTVDRYTPQRELLREAFYNTGYNIAEWPVFSSMLAILSGLHPAIIFRTILPSFEIPFAYFIVYLLLNHFFINDRKKTFLGLIYSQLFVLITAEKLAISSEWWLVVNCWSGKALAFNIITPLILWCLFNIEDSSTEERPSYWKLLFLVCFAACLIAASLFMIVPLELAIWGMFYLFRTKRWKDTWKFALCSFPTVACAFLVMIA